MMCWPAFLVKAGVSLPSCLQLLGLPVTTTAKADIDMAFAALDHQSKAVGPW
jgi:hypothetical protein